MKNDDNKHWTQKLMPDMNKSNLTPTYKSKTFPREKRLQTCKGLKNWCIGVMD
jgi:hypothetical protein